MSLTFFAPSSIFDRVKLPCRISFVDLLSFALVLVIVPVVSTVSPRRPSGRLLRRSPRSRLLFSGRSTPRGGGAWVPSHSFFRFWPKCRLSPGGYGWAGKPGPISAWVGRPSPGSVKRSLPRSSTSRHGSALHGLNTQRVVLTLVDICDGIAMKRPGAK